ncbi:YolD-like family protein [Ornithinibacillus californiensis]|uniref:YolD-like family protein n=1 Tax=Ornithinibacillus californiensis TaxID=161536 RepID=UPI00064E131F|nr:YolD-like family protein [Ornithinibacillus californiensis]
MVNDRGSIKWTSLMLPEHVELLRTIWSEDKRVTRPKLDEQELEVLNIRLLEAYNEQQLIQIEYYQKGRMVNIRGGIKKFDQLSQTVVIQSSEEETAVPFTDIYRVE